MVKTGRAKLPSLLPPAMGRVGRHRRCSPAGLAPGGLPSVLQVGPQHLPVRLPLGATASVRNTLEGSVAHEAPSYLQVNVL